MHITPITEPYPNLNGFIQACGQKQVNEVDAKRIHLTEKFKELSNLPVDIAFDHMYLAFSFTIPATLYLEVQAFGLPIVMNAEIDGMLFTGIMSASFRTWKKFLLLATHKDQSEWLIGAANGMYTNTFIQIPYFKDLKYSSSALVKA